MCVARICRAASLIGRAVAWGALASAMASCAENQVHSTGPALSERIKLSATPVSVPKGGLLELKFSNNLREPLGYSLCTSAVETVDGQTVHIGRICTREFRILRPGRSARYYYELSPGIAAGRYRILTNAERMNSGTHDVIRSNYFEVR